MRGSRGWLGTGIILIIVGIILIIVGAVMNGRVSFGALQGGGYGYGYWDGTEEIVPGIIMLCAGAAIFIVRAVLANKAKQDAAKCDDRQRQVQENGASQGDPVALFLMGARYYSGNGVTKDISKAFSSFKAAAEKGHAGSMYELAGLYERGEGTGKDEKIALDWYKKAESLGNKMASVKVGEFYRDGKGGLELDPGEAFKRFSAASGAGVPEGYYCLGLAYLDGVGCGKDLELARNYMNRAAQADVPGAAERLKEMMNTSGYGDSGVKVPPAENRGSAPPVSGSGSSASADDEDGNTVLIKEEDDKTALIDHNETVIVRTKDGKEFPVTGDTFTIGRSKQKCDLVVDSPSVSNTHACIIKKEGKLYIKDLGSSNHTFVNGSRIEEGKEINIKSGDVISLAKEEFKLTDR